MVEVREHFEVRRGGPLVLSGVAFAALVAGLVGPSFHVDTVGFLRSGPESIAAGLRLLFEQGHWGLAVVLLVFSVLFPLSKIMALVRVLCFHNRVSATYLAWLETLGPLSLLDAVVLVILMVAYAGIPVVNATVVPEWGYWSFVCSIFLNSCAVSLSSSSSVPTRKP